jgi:tRNA A37 methylthiotransferase MiaB
VIVGFPGERDEDFEATCRVVEQAGVSKVHAFRFSARPGTEAAAMADRVAGDVVQQRAARIGTLASRLRTRYMEGLVGRKLQVLVESSLARTASTLLGTSDRYVPVQFQGCEARIGRFVSVVATGLRRGPRGGPVLVGAP